MKCNTFYTESIANQKNLIYVGFKLRALIVSETQIFGTRSGNVGAATKLTFFRASVESILLYGAETWIVKSDLQERLHGTYTLAFL